MTLELKALRLEKNNRICKIYLNKPESKNVLDSVMKAELNEIIEEVHQDSDIRVLILTGVGSAFCAGGDLRSMEQPFPPFAGRTRIKNSHQWLRKLIDLEIPVIAAVNGVAAGAGVNLALACDMVIASDKATFIQSFIKVGLIPDFGGFYFLPRLIGLHKAKELMFTGISVDAHEGERIGLINKVVPGDELMRYVEKFALDLANSPANSLALIKRLTNLSLESNFESMLELEAMAQDMCFGSDDFVDGRKAFVEKRKPIFRP